MDETTSAEMAQYIKATAPYFKNQVEQSLNKKPPWNILHIAWNMIVHVYRFWIWRHVAKWKEKGGRLEQDNTLIFMSPLTLDDVVDSDSD